jgi:hypothetical protein
VVELPGEAGLRAASALPVGTNVLAGIRPEHVKLDIGRGDTGVIGKGRVVRALDDGVLVTAWISWGSCEVRTVAISGRGLGSTLAAGDAISFAVRPQDVHLLAR